MPSYSTSRARGARRARLLLLAAILSASLLAAATLQPDPAQAIGPSSRVRIVRLLLPGQAPTAHAGLARVIALLTERTNVSMSPRPETVRAADSAAAIASHPLLWTISTAPLPRLPASTVSGLREAIRRGGTWVVDGPADAAKRPPFLASVRRALRRILPGGRLTRLGSDHTLFKSFYLLAPARLRRRWGPVRALSRDGRAAVLVVHGVAAALAPSGAAGLSRPNAAWGSEWPRRLAVNLLLYALCVDYKSDQVHAAAILRRRRGRGPPAVTPGHSRPRGAR